MSLPTSPCTVCGEQFDGEASRHYWVEHRREWWAVLKEANGGEIPPMIRASFMDDPEITINGKKVT